MTDGLMKDLNEYQPRAYPKDTPAEAAARKAGFEAGRIYEASLRDGMACQDEGCPHAGTPHAHVVTVTPDHEVIAIDTLRAAARTLRDDLILRGDRMKGRSKDSYITVSVSQSVWNNFCAAIGDEA